MFDFDATLPLMALQFLLLVLILNAVFYRPLGKILDERAEYIRNQEQQARERISKSQAVTQEYELKIADARRQSQAILEQAQTEARNITADKIAQAQQEVQQQREAAAAEINQQKQAAMNDLEQQVEGLSNQIISKLLGPELAK